MQVRKSAKAKQPGYPSSRQMARLARSIGAVAIGLAAPVCAAEGTKTEAPLIRTAGRIVVEPHAQVPGGLRVLPPETTNNAGRGTQPVAPEKAREGQGVVTPAQSCSKTNEPPKLLGTPPMPKLDGAGR